MKIIESQENLLILKHGSSLFNLIFGIVFVLAGLAFVFVVIFSKGQMATSSLLIYIAVAIIFIFVGAGVALFGKSYDIIFNKAANRLTLLAKSLIGEKATDYEISKINKVYLEKSLMQSVARPGETRGISVGGFSIGRQGAVPRATETAYKIIISFADGKILPLGGSDRNYAKIRNIAEFIAKFLNVEIMEG